MNSQKVFTVIENGIPKENVFTSLQAACQSVGASYYAAVRGKTRFLVKGNFITINPATLVKIKGRGKKSFA